MIKFKPLLFFGTGREDLKKFPAVVRDEIGYALYQAQRGNKHRKVKPLKGFKGAGVLEMVEDFDGNTYRAVYTVRFGDIVYVLHCFQKKSKKGIATPKHILDLVEKRYREVERQFKNKK